MARTWRSTRRAGRGDAQLLEYSGCARAERTGLSWQADLSAASARGLIPRRRSRYAVRMAKLCEGRIAIVTGAGRGIGREHALSLAAHGARVVGNDRGGARDGSGASAGPAEEVVATIRSAGGEAIVNADDVSDWGGAERLVRQAVDTFGGLDVLVNNAGILRDRMLVNMTHAEWDAVIN